MAGIIVYIDFKTGKGIGKRTNNKGEKTAAENYSRPGCFLPIKKNCTGGEMNGSNSQKKEQRNFLNIVKIGHDHNF